MSMLSSVKFLNIVKIHSWIPNMVTPSILAHSYSNVNTFIQSKQILIGLIQKTHPKLIFITNMVYNVNFTSHQSSLSTFLFLQQNQLESYS